MATKISEEIFAILAKLSSRQEVMKRDTTSSWIMAPDPDSDSDFDPEGMLAAYEEVGVTSFFYSTSAWSLADIAKRGETGGVVKAGLGGAALQICLYGWLDEPWALAARASITLMDGRAGVRVRRGVDVLAGILTEAEGGVEAVAGRVDPGMSLTSDEGEGKGEEEEEESRQISLALEEDEESGSKGVDETA